jgi:dihydroorotase
MKRKLENYEIDFIQVTSQRIIKRIRIQEKFIEEMTENTRSKRKIRQISKEIETEIEEIIEQNPPNKRIKGDLLEQETITLMNKYGLQPIRTREPDRGIDFFGEYKGIQIYGQCKNHERGINIDHVKQLEGILSNKPQPNIGVLIGPKSTSKATDTAQGSMQNILLTTIENFIEKVFEKITQIQQRRKREIKVIIEETTQIDQIETIEETDRKTIKLFNVKGALTIQF